MKRNSGDFNPRFWDFIWLDWTFKKKILCNGVDDMNLHVVCQSTLKTPHISTAFKT